MIRQPGRAPFNTSHELAPDGCLGATHVDKGIAHSSICAPPYTTMAANSGLDVAVELIRDQALINASRALPATKDALECSALRQSWSLLNESIHTREARRNLAHSVVVGPALERWVRVIGYRDVQRASRRRRWVAWVFHAITREGR